MFDQLQPAPPDPILGLTEAFKKDPSAQKINLSVGVYQDETGTTPILNAVKAAEQALLSTEKSKGYLGIQGSPAYGAAVRALIFGGDHELAQSGRATTLHTPGGTGALRLAGELCNSLSPGAQLWLPAPTWPNHAGIFKAAGISLKSYPYFDAGSHQLNRDGLFETLKTARAGDFVLLHGCCHNPSGVALTAEDWRALGELLRDRKAIPVVDFAYQGLGNGLDEDAEGIRILSEMSPELLICSSFSKNFGLYCERVGALTLVAQSATDAQSAASHAKLRARTNYSNPPAHGSHIVSTILASRELTQQWHAELETMRQRILDMRRGLVKTLEAKGAKRDFKFLIFQNGMFSFSGLNEEQVATLRERHAIYIVKSGRLNVAGITPANLDRLCDAIVSVL